MDSIHSSSNPARSPHIALKRPAVTSSTPLNSVPTDRFEEGEGPVRVDAWGHGHNDSLEKIARSNGYSLRDCYSKGQDGKTLLQHVAAQNGLKNPNLLQAGSTIEMARKHTTEQFSEPQSHLRRATPRQPGAQTRPLKPTPVADVHSGLRHPQGPASPSQVRATVHSPAVPAQGRSDLHSPSGRRPEPTAAPNPLSAISTDLAPMGKSKYSAFGGLSWDLSANQGEATVERAADSLQLHSSLGDAKIVDDPQHPGHVNMNVLGTKISGVISARQNGFIAKSDDGRSIELVKDGDHSDVHLHGFGNYDSMGIFLQRKP